MHARSAQFRPRAIAVLVAVTCLAASLLVPAAVSASAYSRPAVPSGLTVTSSPKGTYLTWDSGAATGFSVGQATNSSMSQNRRDYSLSGPVHQFTPYGLKRGTTYYFKVRAMNGYTPSPYTGVVGATAQSDEQNVSVATYNITSLNTDGSRLPGGIIAPWSQRRIPAATLIKQWHPDVLAVQEGNPLVPGYTNVRQVDSFRSALQEVGASYNVADTEDYTYGDPGYVRTGNYVLYNPSIYAAYGTGGHWALGDGKYAAWQELENRSSGARFVFVSTHLTAGGSASNDASRKSETEILLSQGTAKANDTNVPVVYAGDFNSAQSSPPYNRDTPSMVLAGGNVVDAWSVAQAYTNLQYNTYNRYMRTPPADYLAIDKVYAPPGVAAYSWRQILNLSGGAYVGTIPSDHNPLYSLLVIPHCAVNLPLPVSLCSVH